MPANTAGRHPLPRGTALRAVVRCFAVSVWMLGRGQVHWPRANVDRALGFADDSTARVYRETVADTSPRDPCFLAVSFRLRWVRGRGHAWFRRESILNTPLFVGFPGFVSKLRMAHDGRGTYRGLYEWDGADRAENYARSLWRVLELVSERDSIDYRVFAGLSRDQVLAEPDLLGASDPPDESAWWRPVAP